MFNIIIFIFFFAVAIEFAMAAPVAVSPWEAFDEPTADAPLAVGGYTNGCLLGGEALAPEGPGYQVVRLARQRHYAHPELVQYLSDLGRRVESAGIGTMLVADVAMPRGGPFEYGHRSHQTGLDADVWLRLDVPPLPREQRRGNDDVEALSMVDTGRFRVVPGSWTQNQAELLRLAASDDRVARIFVHPAIKKALCDAEWPAREWLRRIRPWHRHTAHFHVRLRCPAGDSSCVAQDEPPAGDGCGEELSAWLPPNYRPPSPRQPGERPPLPARCQAMLGDTSTVRTN